MLISALMLFVPLLLLFVPVMNLLAKLMVLHHHILFNLAIAAIAEIILMLTSAEQVSSLHRVAPRYLKLVTSF